MQHLIVLLDLVSFLLIPMPAFASFKKNGLKLNLGKLRFQSSLEITEVTVP